MSSLLFTMQEIAELIDCREYFASGGDGDPPALVPEDYARLSSMLDSMLEENPQDSLLRFWRGWAYQFLERETNPFEPHPNFERVEDSYRSALEIDPTNHPAAMMLTCLYVQSAIPRARQHAAIEHGFHSLEETAELALQFQESLYTLSEAPSDQPTSHNTAEDDTELAYNIFYGPTRQLTEEDQAAIRPYRDKWLFGTGAEIAEQVYAAAWIYEGEPVPAFYTDYIGWLWLVERVLPLTVPEDQVGTLLFELTLTWDNYGDTEHPLRGMLFEKALAWGIGDPVAFMKCLTLALHHLSGSLSNNYDWNNSIGEFLLEGLEWIQDANNQKLPEFGELRYGFAAALGEALAILGNEHGAIALIDAAEWRGRHQDVKQDTPTPAVPSGPPEWAREFLAEHKRMQQKVDETHAVAIRIETKVEGLYDLIYESVEKFEKAADRDREVERLAERIGSRLTWADAVVRHFDGALKRAPVPFQMDVIVGEALFDYCVAANYPNFAPVVVHWGRLVEIWMRDALLVPFGRWLDDGRSSVNFMKQLVEQSPNTLDKNGSWEATFNGQLPDGSFRSKKVHAYALLRAAAGDPVHPLTTYLNTLEGTITLSRWKTKNVFPDRLKELRDDRNDSAHEKAQVTLSTAQRSRKLLWDDRLLTELCALLIANDRGNGKSQKP